MNKRGGALVFVATLGAVGVASGSLHAKGPDDSCLAAPVEGQKLRRADKLLDARERFSLCARRTCPNRIVQECTRWLHEVDDILPSVVPAAHDGRGADLLDVRLSIDDQPPTDISARAIPLDPGPHKLVFQRQGSEDITQNVLVREGEKNREVTVVFKAPEPPPSPPPPPPAFERPVPVAVWVLGGLTVVGGALFATFGALGVSERGSTCAPQGCTESQRDSIETKFRIGDISLAVGAAALVTGTVLFFTRAQVEKPAPLSARALADLRDAVTRSPRAYLGVAPNKGGGALVVGARF